MYQKLFEQGKIGKLDIKSRTVMPAMGGVITLQLMERQLTKR